jgi:hypothetical protein
MSQLAGRKVGDRVDWRWLAVGLMALLVAVGLAQVWQVTNHHDLDVFLRAAQRLRAGEDIYAGAEAFQRAIESGTFSLRDDSVVWPYAYTPLIAALFVPASLLPHAVAAAGWWGLNVLFLLVGSWLCLRSLGRVTPDQVALTLLALYRFAPAVAALRLGQVELLQFALLALMLDALRRRQDGLAGVALGLAAGLKFFPIALVAWLVWRRRWRAAAVAVGVTLVLTVGSLALVGADAAARYWHLCAMYGIGGAYAAFPLNQSLNGFISRNLITNVFGATLRGWHLPGLARGLVLAADAVIVAVSAWLTFHGLPWRREEQPVAPRIDGSEGALAVAALLLVSPHSQVYGFVWALVPLVALLGWLRAQGTATWWQWALLILGYLLLGRDYQLFVPGITRFVQSHYMFGALLLWALLARVLWTQRPAGPARQG